MMPFKQYKSVALSQCWKSWPRIVLHADSSRLLHLKDGQGLTVSFCQGSLEAATMVPRSPALAASVLSRPEHGFFLPVAVWLALGQPGPIWIAACGRALRHRARHLRWQPFINKAAIPFSFPCRSAEIDRSFEIS